MSAELVRTDPMPEPTPVPDPPLFAAVMGDRWWPVWTADGLYAGRVHALEAQFAMAFALDGPRGPLPTRSTIELDAENQIIAFISSLPQYQDGVRPEWRQLVNS